MDLESADEGVRRTEYSFSPRSRERVVGFHMIRVWLTVSMSVTEFWSMCIEKYLNVQQMSVPGMSLHLSIHEIETFLFTHEFLVTYTYLTKLSIRRQKRLQDFLTSLGQMRKVSKC